MKKELFFSIIAAAVSLSGVAQSTITSLDGLSNSKAVAISRISGKTTATIGSDGSSLTQSSTASEWAIYNYRGEYFLYNLANKKFATASATLSTASPVSVLPFYIPEHEAWLLDCGGSLLGFDSEAKSFLFTADVLGTEGMFFTMQSGRTITDAEQAEIEAAVKPAYEEKLATYTTFVTNAENMAKDGLTNYAGAYDVDALKEALATPDNYTLPELEALYQAALLSRYPKSGHYYRIANRTRPSSGVKINYLSVTRDQSTLSVRKLANPKLGIAADGYAENLCLFQFEPVGSTPDQVKVKACATETYFGTGSAGNSIGMAVENQATTYTLDPTGDFSRFFRFKDNSRSWWLTCSGGYTLVPYANDESSNNWYFEEVTEIPYIIPASDGFLLLNLPCGVTLPDGVHAYVAKAELYNNRIFFVELDSRDIPANTPVLIESEQGSASLRFPVAVDVAPLKESNILRGTNVYLESVDAYHTLAHQGTDGKLENLSMVTGTDATMQPNNAYMADESLYSKTGDFAIVSTDDGTRANLNEITIDDASAEYYDLQGRRVVDAHRGIVVDGKSRSVILLKK